MTEDRQLAIAVDFDGVIANYEGWGGTGSVGSPRTDVVSALETLWSGIRFHQRRQGPVLFFVADRQVEVCAQLLAVLTLD